MLLDILPTKTNITDWYKNFRGALLNPQGGNVTKQRYRFLVEFLDNTLIHRPSSQGDRLSEARNHDQQTKYPRFDPLPNISDIQKHPVDVLNVEKEKDESIFIKPPSSESEFTKEVDTINSSISLKKDSHRPMVLIKGLFHQWIPVPNNFRSLLGDLPTEPAQNITEEANPHDVQEQLQRERRAVTILRKIEVTLALARRRQLPPGFELCTCDAVQEMLSDRDAFHLYLKHVRTLQEADIDVAKEICASYQSVLGVLAADPASEINRQTVATGFRLVDLLAALEMLPQAKEMLVAIINFLNVNPGLETWMSEYNAHVRMMGLHNDMCELNEAQSSYFSATQLTYQIQLVSFGQRLVFEGRLHKEISAMLLENGSINSSLGWARQALQEVDPNDHESVIEVVSHAVLAHCASWQVKKAEELAVFAVQLAREKYGKLHPLYLKALHSLCHFCNEFKQDSTGVELAKELVELTRKTYKCETLHLAQAHRVLSKAIMAQQDFYNSNSFYHHAMEAIRIARSLLSPGHPMLHPFLSNFAMALQWKSLSCPEEVRESTLSWAETEAKQALMIVSMHHGEISLRAAQIYILLGQILSKMNKLEEAEKYLIQSVDYLTLCQPPTSNYLLLAHATLGTFFKVTGKFDKAVFHLKQVVMLIEPCGI
ncbi:amyloid protein-binding protein 2-like isoform X2 [Pomacea canaliculata]|nr:amyloid protein-binding protein 2-like isoform X2 [Pomacea canaliculata]XP_025109219.1 amyloid protein-binding protein 2-like isoform X2 [Pomacea canaliculata]XP_025109220.1 amyloid protein-binding protein 2-like isoform X2 [Pomacea canaliculata]